jgi:hypothetical protein
MTVFWTERWKVELLQRLVGREASGTDPQPPA